MEEAVRKGIRLLLFSIIYFIILLIIGHKFGLGSYAMIYYIIFDSIYLGICFYFGFKSRLGFKKGVAIGIIGSAFLWIPLLISLIKSIVNQNPDHAYTVNIGLPLLPAIIAFYPLVVIGGEQFIRIKVVFLVLVLILIVAFGSWLGKKLSR